jgi:hypothetical protein
MPHDPTQPHPQIAAAIDRHNERVKNDAIDSRIRVVWGYSPRYELADRLGFFEGKLDGGALLEYHGEQFELVFGNADREGKLGCDATMFWLWAPIDPPLPYDGTSRLEICIIGTTRDFMCCPVINFDPPRLAGLGLSIMPIAALTEWYWLWDGMLDRLQQARAAFFKSLESIDQ